MAQICREPVLPDLVKEGLKVLFVGYNPSLRSAELGHHYAGRSNRFWELLHKSGLTPRKLTFHEDAELLNYGYGTTNIVHRPTKEAAEITKEEYEVGAGILKELIGRLHPAFICYVGVGVYRAFARRTKVSWGQQAESVVPGSFDFVAPSSSGLNRMPIPEQIAIYAQLAQLLKKA